MKTARASLVLGIYMTGKCCKTADNERREGGKEVECENY